MNNKILVIVFVLAVLLIAAVLVFWKPGVNTKYRFVRLSIGNLLIHLMDGFITYVNTPDLSMEGNILVSKFGYGWGALFLANFVCFILIILAAWLFCRYEHKAIPSKGKFDYYMLLFYGENYKWYWGLYKFSKNIRSTAAMCGYVVYWSLTLGSPVFVLGWIRHMLGFRLPRGWNDNKIAFVIAIVTMVFCTYRWIKAGYEKSVEEFTQVG